MPQRVWVYDRSGTLKLVSEAEATDQELLSRRDLEWAVGRPLQTLKRVSRAKRAQVPRGIDLRELEQMIAGDLWIGVHQRGQMLREVRALAEFYASRKETNG